jgi:hypothetical protein
MVDLHTSASTGIRSAMARKRYSRTGNGIAMPRDTIGLYDGSFAPACNRIATSRDHFASP